MTHTAIIAILVLAILAMASGLGWLAIAWMRRAERRNTADNRQTLREVRRADRESRRYPRVRKPWSM